MDINDLNEIDELDENRDENYEVPSKEEYDLTAFGTTSEYDLSAFGTPYDENENKSSKVR